jgi:GTP-binding protein YchF
MELGIIGLPTSGKTTIFNALTKSDRPTQAASTGRLELVSAAVDVPDNRLTRISQLVQPKKTTYARVVYTDIAGLDKDLAKQGLSGKLRNRIAPLEALVHVVRAFEDPRVPHVLGSADPARDLANLDGEFLLADMVTVDNRLDNVKSRLSKGVKGEERKTLEREQVIFERLEKTLANGDPLRDANLTDEERKQLRAYGLLTLKPVLVLLNTGDEPINPDDIVTYDHHQSNVLALQGKLEMELSQMSTEEAEMFMDEFGISELALNRVIQASYNLLDLQSFFTTAEKEVRAWTIPIGATALDAAGTIHTDMARGFVRAEVVSYEDFVRYGDLTEARKEGAAHVEGKEYIVQDGDVIHIRFSS